MPTNIGGIRVPDTDGAEEVCHNFVIAVLKASGALGADTEDKPLPHNAQNILFPKGEAGYTPARINGNLTVQPGAVIGFWEGGHLQHTMYAETQSTWWGSRNLYTFGVNGSRLKFDNIGSHANWVGTGNQWKGAYTASITWRLIPR